MRKFTTIALSIVCGWAAANADTTVYLLGEFNNWGEGDLSEWELTVDETSDFEAKGTFNIPEGEFAVSFLIDGEYYGPNRRSGNDPIVFDDGEFFVTLKIIDEPQAQMMVYDDWAGGDIDILMEIINNGYYVTFTDPNYVPSDEPEIAYVVGAFNEYSEDDDDYVLTFDEDEYAYVGYIEIPEGEFSFNVYVPSEETLYVPVDNETTEITFENNVYYGDTDNYSTSWKEMYWEYSEWEGGYVKITLDTDGGTIKIEIDDESAVKSLNAEKTNNQIFNIHGVKVDRENLTPGLYIIDGKKVMIKK